MIKGFIFDIDDTLTYRPLKQAPASTLKALKKLKEKGYALCACTAREKVKLKTVPHELMKLFDFVSVGNGSAAYKDHKLFKANIIKKDDFLKYYDFIKKHNYPYYYSLANGKSYIWGEFSLEYTKKLLFWWGQIPFERYIKENDEVVSLMIQNINDDEYETLININPNVKPIRYHNGVLLCAEGVDKVSGIDLFLNTYGFTKDEVIAFGDGASDASMIEYSKYGVAIKDSELAHLNVADFVTDKTVIDGGIYEFMCSHNYIERDIPDIKIFYFDIDSTTYDHSIKDVRDTTVYALDKLREKGIKTCICTSRSLDEMKMLPKKLLDRMDGVVSVAGGMINFGDIKINKIIDKQAVIKAFQILEENNVPYRYVLTNGIGYRNKENEENANIYRSFYDMAPDVKRYDGEDVVHILFHTNDENIIHKIQNEVTNCKHLHLGLANEIMALNTDKASGMFELAERLGIDKECVGAFGDGNNDAEMLEKAQLGIALGNAKEKAKIVADYVTDDISYDGLCNALVKYGYIEERKI